MIPFSNSDDPSDTGRSSKKIHFRDQITNRKRKGEESPLPYVVQLLLHRLVKYEENVKRPCVWRSEVNQEVEENE